MSQTFKLLLDNVRSSSNMSDLFKSTFSIEYSSCRDVEIWLNKKFDCPSNKDKGEQLNEKNSIRY